MGVVAKVVLLSTTGPALPGPDSVSWVAARFIDWKVTLSNCTGAVPVIATGALLSVSPVTWVPPAIVKSRLPPLIAGAVATGRETKSPFTRIGVESEKPGVWAETSRRLKWEPVPGVAKSRASVAPVASTTLWDPEGA